MTSEAPFELLATHQLDCGRLLDRWSMALSGEGGTAIEVEEINRPDEDARNGISWKLIRVRVWDTRSGELVQDFPADTFWTKEQPVLGFDVDLSGDGSKLAIVRWPSGDADVGTWSVRVLDTRTGEVLVSESLRQFEGATFVRFSGDGRFLVYANPESDRPSLNAVGVIDVEAGATVLDLEGDYHCGVLSANGRRVAMEEKEAAWVWSVDPPSRSWDESMPIPRATFGISDAAFDSDGSLVLTSGGDGSARVWNVETGAQLLKLDHRRHVLRGRFSSDGSRILTACAGGAVRLWDARNGDLVGLLANGGGFESQFAFSPDGLSCATGGDDGVVRLWNSVTGEPLGKPISHPDLVSRIAFTLDGKRLVSASESEVLLSDAESGVTRAQIDGKLLAISVEHDLIVVGGERFMQLRDTRDGSVVWALNHGMIAAAISPDGSRLLCTEKGRDVYDFDVVSGAPVGLFAGPYSGWVSSRLSYNSIEFGTDLELSPDGSRSIRLGSDEGSVASIDDAHAGNRVSELRGHTLPSSSPVEFDPSGERLLTIDDGTMVRVWEAETGRELSVLPALQHDGTDNGRPTKVTQAKYSPDGSFILTTGDDGRIRFWDPVSGDVIATLDAGTTAILAGAEFSPDGKTVLAACGDYSLRLWDVSSGRELAVMQGHDSKIDAFSFSADGQEIVTISGSTLRRWGRAGNTATDSGAATA